uniref:white n=1 Tax=Drosophila melanogaster TaxID=7227 RepID=UPI0000124D9F|nr:white [Drosophila melanogaster]AAV97853.1 white [P-element transposon vector UASp]ADW11127.1 white [InSITE enhancer fusion vector pBMPGal4LWL]ADW11128.1 white [InSITE injectable donor vector pBPHLWL]ADW11129.1 white [InSITE genetic donor vector P element transposon vector pXN-FBLWLF]ADW11131.1 white [InSITE enhancer trap piggyBac transposon vector pXL-BACII-attPGAL4LwL]ADW11133.1 white [InSITE enhancer trap P element transposon vector pXN-attPGal4LwL]ADZ15152.1 white [Reporter vector pHon|eukprot:NP_476787.1 white [Drosophila melanogaster]
MGQEDQELLIRGGSKHPSAEHLNNGDSGAASQSCINQGFGQAKNYGTLRPPSPPEDSGSGSGQLAENLTYAWHNMDIFGAVNQPGSGWRQLVNRTRGLFCNERHIPAPRKHLLKNVCGVAYPGELLAVMGSSGAGKTTLLNALAFRSPQGIQVSPSGMRLLNGQPVDAKEMQARCAYVQQDDLFIGSLTAREHLIFQAMVRMPRHLTYRQRVARVDQVIQELSLSKCQHTIIGVPGRVKGLSGGERKRLAFASEALTDPPLLICDEPTSGLDSFTAHSVVQVLKKLSQKGKTVILTIHQPSSELFELFDKILLMAEGRVAFLGTPSEAVDFFSYVGAQCPTNYNPADFYVQVLAVVPGREIESRDRIAKICDNFAISKVARDMEQLLATKNLEKPLEQPENGYTYKATWFMQFRAVLWRSWLSVLKEPLLVKVRLIQTTMVAILIGLIFLGQQLTQVGVMNINGAIFLFLTNMTFQNVFATINVFTSELPVFMREARSRLYRCDTYFLGKTIAELPLFLTVPLVFTAIAYPMIGLRAGVLHFFNCLALVTLVANVSTSFGYLISCASSSTSMALSVGPPVIIPFLLFGGFFLNSGSVPVYLKWLSYLSWFRYANEGLLINQWADVEPGEISCTSSNTTCPSSGKVILETLNFSAADLPLDYVGLAILIVSFRVLAYLALRLRARRKE